MKRIKHWSTKYERPV